MTSGSDRVDGAWTIERLLREHPWPAAHARAPRLEWLWVIDVALPPAELWPLVSDLSRLNRALGNPELRFEEQGGVRRGRGRYGGLAHEWEEVAWDWVAGQWFAFDRIYRRGAMTALHAIHRLVPAGAGTLLHVYFGVTPRWRVLAPALRASFGKLGRAYRRVVPRLAEEAKAGALPASEPPPPLPAQAASRLAAAAERLRGEGVDGDVVDRLLELVTRGDDLDVHRLQVRVLARRWGKGEDEVLHGFLHATRAGVLELTWDLVCPHCRGVRASETRLAAVPTRGGCDACAIEFGTSEAVEVSFRIHPAIREVPARHFCSAEPATKPHIELQRALAPGTTATVEVDLAPGRYRLRGRGEGPTGSLDVHAGAAARDPVAWRQSAPPAEQAAPPHAALELINDASGPRTFILERAAAAELALRPGRVLSDPDFRALFSEDFLGDDVRLAVGEQTLLFTDIVGSTAMYAERGDPVAFTSVRHHFTETFALVASHRGVVVKTIGDATMAAFVDPADAVRAAIAIQRAFADPTAIRLRVSLNTGTCIAVRLNADIDYFGHAVNVAAKLQAMVEAGQVVLSERTHASPGVAAALADAGLPVEELAVSIKGLAASTRAYRMNVS